MISFRSKILKAISDYKLIIRKALPTIQCTTKMRELGIKRKNIQDVDDVGLYNIGLKIINELKKYPGINSKKSNNSYKGTREFLQYLEKIFVDHYVDGSRIVHIKQESSCALVEVIQLVTSVKNDKFSKESLKKIRRCGDIITSYGNEEQKKMFFNVIGSNSEIMEKL